MPQANHDVTELLVAWRHGDEGALDELMPLVYDELRQLAARYLKRERVEHTLQPTALVNEAYLRMVGKERPQLKDRVHFFAVAATVMRRILVDHARRRAAAKRGGGVGKISLDDHVPASAEEAAEILSLNSALEELAELDARQERVIELRFFGGLTVDETAEYLGVSPPTVVNDTRAARAWLYRRLKHPGDPPTVKDPSSRS